MTDTAIFNIFVLCLSRIGRSTVKFFKINTLTPAPFDK